MSSLILSFILLVAGTSKLAYRREFALDLQRNQLVPSRLAAPTSFALPLIEIAVAVGLTMSPTSVVFSAASATLFLTFAGFLAFHLARGHRSCRCFGIPETITWASVVRNLALAMLSASLVPSSQSSWLMVGASAGFGYYLVNVGRTAFKRGSSLSRSQRNVGPSRMV